MYTSLTRGFHAAISQLKWSWFQEARPLRHLARFDEASRGGVGGAFAVIGLQRGIRLASLGAAITLLSIATDPLIQQVIRYDPCLQLSLRGQASMARTNNYTDRGIHTGAGQASLDPPMEAAMYQGVFNSSTPVRPVCSTGNCTFPEFSTLGVCSSCEDVSHTQ